MFVLIALVFPVPKEINQLFQLRGTESLRIKKVIIPQMHRKLRARTFNIYRRCKEDVILHLLHERQSHSTLLHTYTCQSALSVKRKKRKMQIIMPSPFYVGWQIKRFLNNNNLPHISDNILLSREISITDWFPFSKSIGGIFYKATYHVLHSILHVSWCLIRLREQWAKEYRKNEHASCWTFVICRGIVT